VSTRASSGSVGWQDRGVGQVHVRRATGDDWALVRDVRLRALADSPAAFASTLEQERAFDEAEWRRRVATANWVLAFDGEQVVGVAAGIVGHEPRPGERHLVAMWVAPRWRGARVGDALVAAVQEWSDEQGCPRLSLWVAEGNEGARRFYRRLGFRATGRRQPFPSDPRVDEGRMERP
jgi:ribosomal protein S18 acetylase RimI-like enzyme